MRSSPWASQSSLPSVKVEDFYEPIDGLDYLPSLNRAMVFLDAGVGGTIDFPGANYLFNGLIRPPYADDPTYPKMKPL